MRISAFSPKQRIVLTWWTPQSPYRQYEAIVCDGAVRSGKTMAMGMGFFLWAMLCFHNQRFGICGKTIQGRLGVSHGSVSFDLSLFY